MLQVEDIKAPDDAVRSSLDPDGPNANLVNASGHVQELSRNFSLLSLAGVGLVVGNVWPAVGGSILVAIFNGGPPGVLYEFIVVSIFYWTIAACLAELASAIPSSAGVYHWATITPGKKWGRIVGFFAGYWNWLAWILGEASITAIFANTVIQMYGLTHPDFVPKSWHVFVVYLISTWIACAIVCLCNKAMPYLNNVGIFFILAGFFITIIVLAVMPGRDGRPPHATSSFVWRDWQADIGYPSGFVFVAGMLNGAFSVGAADATTHLAEEVPNPQVNVPKAILIQYIIGFVTGFAYLISLLYAISDYDALFDSSFPLAEIYLQGSGSTAGAIGLLVMILICLALTMVGLYIETGRMLWTLARDKATPASQVLSTVNKNLDMPFNSTIASVVLVTVLGCIYVGSTTAFNAFVGSFVLMSSASYLAAILPNVLTRRKNVIWGPFDMGSVFGSILSIIACAYMIVWFVIYCFPYSLPATAQNMNYACLIWGGLTLFVAIWWFVGAQKDYVGPQTIGGEIGPVDKAKGSDLKI